MKTFREKVGKIRNGNGNWEPENRRAEIDESRNVRYSDSNIERILFFCRFLLNLVEDCVGSIQLSFYDKVHRGRGITSERR
jgi:hypothetical protein